MIGASHIVHLRTSASDYAETERLKTKFAKLRDERQPFYLTLGEFDEILLWKLAGQYHRQREMRRANTDDVVRTVTQAALSVSHPNQDYETELRVGILIALRGVSIPVASAVLALVFPEKYAVIDFRGWRQVFGREQRGFTIGDYKRYLARLRPLAEELGWPIQEVDLAIWAYDLKYGPPTEASLEAS